MSSGAQLATKRLVPGQERTGEGFENSRPVWVLTCTYSSDDFKENEMEVNTKQASITELRPKKLWISEQVGASNAGRAQSELALSREMIVTSAATESSLNLP